MRKKINSKEFVLLQDRGGIKGIVTPTVPSNISQLGAFLGVLEAPGIMGFVDPISLIWRTTGLSNKILRELLGKLQFKNAEKKAGVQIDLQIVALEKEDGTVDIAIPIACCFQTAYSQNVNRYHPVRSLYQDQVKFRIWPKDPSQIAIDHQGSIPKTEMKEVNYSNSTTWNTKVGFASGVESKGSKMGVSGDISYSFSASANTKTVDFDLAKISEGEADSLGWISRMKNIYSAGSSQPVASGYDPANPYSIVVNGIFTKWLNDPPISAESDLELEFLAAYNCLDHNIKNKVLEFEFSTTQRMMHAEVVGRWGIPGAEVGGVGAVIPFYLFTKGEIKIDFPNRSAEIKKISCDGFNFKQQAEQSGLVIE